MTKMHSQNFEINPPSLRPPRRSTPPTPPPRSSSPSVSPSHLHAISRHHHNHHGHLSRLPSSPRNHHLTTIFVSPLPIDARHRHHDCHLAAITIGHHRQGAIRVCLAFDPYRGVCFYELTSVRALVCGFNSKGVLDPGLAAIKGCLVWTESD
nr:hypothetical protein [Tanacetum cinerariifolium]